MRVRGTLDIEKTSLQFSGERFRLYEVGHLGGRSSVGQTYTKTGGLGCSSSGEVGRRSAGRRTLDRRFGLFELW